MKRITLNIHGRVQGVFFRAETLEQARSLGIVGTVQNEPDGSVTVIGEGTEDALQKLLKWCQRGPCHAHVARCDVVESKATGEFRGFHIIH